MMGPIFRYRIFTLLPKISLLGALSLPDVTFFVRPLRTRRVSTGEVLFREGDAPGDFYVIIEGSFELRCRDQSITTVGEGELIGADAQIGIQRHLFTAVAQTDCVMLVVPARALYRMAREKPGAYGMLMGNIARDLARRLQLMRQIIDVGKRPRRRQPVRDFRLPRLPRNRNRPGDSHPPD